MCIGYCIRDGRLTKEFNMGDRFNVTLGPLAAVDAETGEEVFNSGAGGMKWNGVSYADLVMIEQLMVGLQQQLVDFGKANAEAKARGKKR